MLNIHTKRGKKTINPCYCKSQNMQCNNSCFNPISRCVSVKFGYCLHTNERRPHTHRTHLQSYAILNTIINTFELCQYSYVLVFDMLLYEICVAFLLLFVICVSIFMHEYIVICFSTSIFLLCGQTKKKI